MESPGPAPLPANSFPPAPGHSQFGTGRGRLLPGMLRFLCPAWGEVAPSIFPAGTRHGEGGVTAGKPFHTHPWDGGDAAAARAGCFSTRVLVGLTFPTISLVFQLPRLGLLDQNKVTCAVHLPWDTCGRVRCVLDRIYHVHGSTNSFMEMENCGKRVRMCPQDALLGLPHLLRLKEGMHLRAK